MADILVIGSNSFSGASFISFCLNLGKKVVGVSRSEVPIDALFAPKLYAAKYISNFKFYQIDLNKDLNKLNEILKQEKPEYVVNFAAQSMVGQSWAYPSHWYQTNLVSLSLLTKLLMNSDWLSKYVHVTTPEVYGSTQKWIEESWLFDPSTPYALSRAAGDQHLRLLHKETAFPVVFTRAANIYGETQQLYRLLPRAVISALLGRKMELHGGGLSTRSFIHAEDVASATSLLLEKGVIGESYHISTTQSFQIKEIIEKIGVMFDIELSELATIVPDRVGKDEAYLLDSSKLRSLNWMPNISLEEGLHRVVDWASSQIKILENTPMEYIHKK